jgi:hypothetical protein
MPPHRPEYAKTKPMPSMAAIPPAMSDKGCLITKGSPLKLQLVQKTLVIG